jgi:hypothetical protein
MLSKSHETIHLRSKNSSISTFIAFVEQQLKFGKKKVVLRSGSGPFLIFQVQKHAKNYYYLFLINKRPFPVVVSDMGTGFCSYFYQQQQKSISR